MVEEPTPTMVTVLPAIVATNKFELVYVKLPSLLDVGGSKVNGADPTAFSGIEKLVRTVVIRFT